MQISARESFFRIFSESDKVFPNIIYQSKSDLIECRSRKSCITIIYSLEWPTIKGNPVRYCEAKEKDSANNVISAIFRTVDFFGRQLGSDLRLVDIRTGCVRVRYLYDESVDARRLSLSLSKFSNFSSFYDATHISALLNGRSVQVSKQ